MSTRGWKTLHGDDIESIYEELESLFKNSVENGFECVVYVGTDSQNLGSRWTSFVQVVAVHLIRDTGQGDGGRVFFVRHLEKRYESRRDRLLREAELSINLAQKINPYCEEWGIHLEVHADVNSDPGENGENKSHEVHDAVAGWIRGMGYTVKTKPEAFVASICADRHTRGLKYKGRSHRKKLDRIESSY